ncbi:MAG: monofunctional biosynthetic peptidoglycan transglycosylase [Gammaproteobacteria bacterium]
MIKKFSLGRKFVRFFFLSFLAFVTGSCLIIAMLRFLPPSTTAFMLYRHYEDFRNGSEFKIIRYHWVKREQISSYAFAAVIAAEDQRFFEHSGFDFDEIYHAFETYLAGGKLRGASTISQQVAKNLFLTPSRSFLRKGVESWFTVLIEWLWPKRRILEMYLNIVEFGDHLFGIEAAAQRFYGIPAKRLSARQAALLAATLPNPLLYRAEKPNAHLLKRRNWILKQMKNLNFSRVLFV